MPIDRQIYRKLIRVPFADGGRGLNGLDCWGLCLFVFSLYGVNDLPDYKISCRHYSAIDKTVKSDIGKWFKKVAQPVEPCLVVMRLDPQRPGYTNHLGVYIGNNTFLHTTSGQKVGAVSLSDPRFAAQIAGFYVRTG